MFDSIVGYLQTFEPSPALPMRYLAYGLGLAVLWLAFGLSRRGRERSASRRLDLAREAGDTEPTSLHPVIDAAKCVGCGACTHACPEGDILGMIGGKAHLIEAAACIGHGACKTACPVGAIELVFGTARRGVDIPKVSPAFESTVPGLFIAGELGGMGLIANAIEQGQQAIAALAGRCDDGRKDLYDVVIVGGGPAGIAASLAAMEKRLRAITFEQDTLGGTVAHYPRGKLVMTRTAHLPLFGPVKARRVRKERLLDVWHSVIDRTGLRIEQGVRVIDIVPHGTDFTVTTSNGSVVTKTVLLATGRRGSPRRLGVPGEDQSKVVYRLDDPAQYDGKNVLVVGGGNSALEAVIALADRPVREVLLSYRGDVFGRAKPELRRRLEALKQAGRVVVATRSTVRAIAPREVWVRWSDKDYTVANDAVIICIGGELPLRLLADAGVEVERKFGTA